jgi:hypothetical protein
MEAGNKPTIEYFCREFGSMREAFKVYQAGGFDFEGERDFEMVVHRNGLANFLAASVIRRTYEWEITK